MIEFDGVQATRGGRMVLDDVSFRVEPGETLVLVGRSGAGKSTILKLINRTLEPSRGEVASTAVHAATLLRYPEVGAALARLAGRVPAAEMRRMNYAVDGERQDPSAVVRAFLDALIAEV